MTQHDEEYFETGALQDDDAIETDVLIGHPEATEDDDEDLDEAEGSDA